MSKRNNQDSQKHAVTAAPEVTDPAAPAVPAAPEATDPATQEAYMPLQDGHPIPVTKPDEPTEIGLRAVHGIMVHPFRPLEIVTDKVTTVTEIDSWLQSQIDARKIVVA